MDNELILALEQILTMGWPGLVTVFLWVVWRRYTMRTDELIDVLREVAGMRTTLRMQRQAEDDTQKLTDSEINAAALYWESRKDQRSKTNPPTLSGQGG